MPFVSVCLLIFFSEVDILTQIPVQASPVGHDGEQTRMHVDSGLGKDAQLLLPNPPIREAISLPMERGVRERKEAGKPLKLKSPMTTTL